MELSSQFAVALAFHVDALVDGKPDEVQRFPALAGHRLRSDSLWFCLSAVFVIASAAMQIAIRQRVVLRGLVVGSAAAFTKLLALRYRRNYAAGAGAIKLATKPAS